MAGKAAIQTHEPLMAGYAGEVDVAQCWKALADDSEAQLVDVRTIPEWNFSGRPNLASLGKTLHMISWKLYPSMELNSAFVSQLQNAVADTDTPLFFLCKTGGRSLDAAIAMTQAGYTQCYNVTDGFEGPSDEHSQRGKLAGWKASKLDWEQS